MNTPSISIIIACYRDEVELEKLLARIDKQTGNISHEVIVIDGARTEACERLCRAWNIERIVSDRACRGYQFTLGGKFAAADILWFLHADALICEDSLTAIMQASQNGINAGFFRFEFEGPKTWIKNIIAWWTNLRARLGGMAYGDQGIFVEKSLYQKAGGHEQLPLFDEVRLLKRLRQMGNIQMLDTSIGINTRRWDRDGYIRRTLGNRFLAFCFMLGISVKTLNKWYRST